MFIYDGSGRIHYFSSFGLTNKPNLTIRALNSEQFPYPDHQPTEESDMALAAILAALGMPEAATEQQAVAFINQLRGDLNTAQNSERAPSLQKFVPRADYDALEQRAVNAEQQLQQRDKDELAKAINSEIEAALAAGKITPATKDYHVAACQEKGGLDRFRDFVKAAPSVTEPVVPEVKLGDQKALNAEQQQAARMLGMSDEQYIKHIEGAH
ncbi:Mu-like prophage I protein [compost metagenome]